MDPISIIGLTTSILTITEHLGKTAKFLIQLSTKLKYADMKITMLVGYLQILNAGVSEIGRITEDLTG